MFCPRWCSILEQLCGARKLLRETKNWRQPLSLYEAQGEGNECLCYYQMRHTIHNWGFFENCTMPCIYLSLAWLQFPASIKTLHISRSMFSILFSIDHLSILISNIPHLVMCLQKFQNDHQWTFKTKQTI